MIVELDINKKRNKKTDNLKKGLVKIFIILLFTTLNNECKK